MTTEEKARARAAQIAALIRDKDPQELEELLAEQLEIFAAYFEGQLVAQRAATQYWKNAFYSYSTI